MVMRMKMMEMIVGVEMRLFIFGEMFGNIESYITVLLKFLFFFVNNWLWLRVGIGIYDEIKWKWFFWLDIISFFNFWKSIRVLWSIRRDGVREKKIFFFIFVVVW